MGADVEAQSAAKAADLVRAGPVESLWRSELFEGLEAHAARVFWDPENARRAQLHAAASDDVLWRLA